MKIYRLKVLFILCLITLICGCANSYTSLKKNNSGDMEIIAASEEEVMSAIYEAISREFPTANINELSGYQTGFSWFHMPMLDRTDFKLTLSNVKGMAQGDKEVSGFSYSVVTHGSQGLVQARYIQPLAEQIDTVMTERGLKKITIHRVVYANKSSMSKDRPSRIGLSTGTGFFVSEEGHVITNYHVIKDSSEISIMLLDGTSIDTKLLQSDPVNDIALLKADMHSMPLKLSPSSTIDKGERVLTLGFPLVGLQGQEQKASFGYINSLSGVKGDIRFLQIDVPIQPGNSGSPLIDTSGNVIGVVTATLDQINTLRATGALPQNVNYAMKSDYVLPVLAGNVDIKVGNENDGIENDMSKLVKQTEESVILVVAQ